jgi:hypothetical protein
MPDQQRALFHAPSPDLLASIYASTKEQTLFGLAGSVEHQLKLSATSEDDREEKEPNTLKHEPDRRMSFAFC